MVIKTIKELKKIILVSKKDDNLKSKAYASILKQVESLTIGVKNPETDETKLILAASKKEMKEQEQSRDAKAPYSEVTLALCSEIVKELSPKTYSYEETKALVMLIIEENDKKMGAIMAAMKTKYGTNLDMKILSDVVKNILS